MIELPILDASGSGDEPSPNKFWRSYAHLENDPDFERAAHDEFMPGITEPPTGASRRQFLQLLGASMAAVGLSACRRPVEHIIPYTRRPEEIIPGIPLFYATSMPFRGVARGLLVESHEGRPTKIEGNPEHPASRGATTAFEQASIYNLYDPYRSQRLLYRQAATPWNEFVRFAQQLGADPAARRLAVLAAPNSSPTMAALRRQMSQRFPQLRWITYRAEGDNNEQQGLGGTIRPVYRFSEATIIASLDGDFLGSVDPNAIVNANEFAQTRRMTSAEDTLSRLYVAESRYSLTGGMADHRLRVRASEIPALASALAARLGAGSGSAASAHFDGNPFVDAMARDLQQAGAGGVVVVGETQPPEVHALVAAMNAAIGSRVVRYLQTDEEPEPPQAMALAQLVDDMRAGRVDALMMLDVNPVYSAPGELGFAEALARVEHSVHAGYYLDETAQRSTWHIPLSHYLEAWGDGRAYDGTRTMMQPLIAPLYNTRSEIEVLNVLATGADRPGYDLVREQWGDFVQGNFDEGWTRLLHLGYLPDSGYPETAAPGGGVDLSRLTAPAPDDIEVVFHLDPALLDGQFSNNAWMQELPDPTTKIVWDNVAVMSRGTAERLDVKVRYDKGRFNVDVVELSVGGRSIELPVWILPGMPDNSISVNLGYGRQIESSYVPPKAGGIFEAYIDLYSRGPIANDVGTNVAHLRSAAMERVVTGVQVRKTRARHTVASTQEHGAMEGRPLVRMASTEEYRANPTFAPEQAPVLPGAGADQEYRTPWEEGHPKNEAAYESSRYYVNQWGMAIDLNVCTGCEACVVACNVENNIQTVGKEEVARGREMQWLRIDRYFVSRDDNADDAAMVVQPIPCMHCENAPCEQVCPVSATSHSSDGINEMTYNRCIGTRYCSNNCPYKVRRFNFFNWSKGMPTTMQMAQNPDVTIRFRGVMEKCTYCVQRVRQAQRRANIEKRDLRDGEVVTACQQACPAEAIIFGDINDPDSRVSQYKRNERDYKLLAHLNTWPRTSYLARITNPNPVLDA